MLVVGYLRLIAGILLLTCSLAGGESAKSLYKKARKAEKAGNIAQAYVWYAEAAAMDPKGGTKAWNHSLALRTKALTEIKQMPAGLDREPPASTEDLGDALLGHITAKDLKEAVAPLPPMELGANSRIESFNLKDNPKALYEKVARAYGLDVVFDGDYNPTKPVRFLAERVGYKEAMRILGAATGTFLLPVSEQLFLVAKDTTQKRKELEPTMAVVVPIPETVSDQEAQELSRAVQQLMDIKKLVIDTSRRLVLIRDRVSRVHPAQVVIDELLHPRPEVVIEVEFVELAKSSMTRYGLSLPSSFPIVWLSNWMGNKPSIPAGFLNFATFGGGMSLFGIGIADAELIATMNRTSANTVLKGEVRSVSGQPAVFHVGDKYPVQTQGYFGPVEGHGKVYTPPPTISFEDLGIMLKLTPYIHGTDEVSLEVDAEFKVLAGETANGIPVISNRSFQGTVRLKNDEWAAMSGLVYSSELRTLKGIAGLANLPYLGALFRQDKTEKKSGQTLLLLKPRLVRLPVAEFMTKQIWTGTETRPLAPL